MTLARTFGAYGAGQRALFELRRVTGLLRTAPRPVRRSVGSAPIPADWPFVPDAQRIRSTANLEIALDRAHRVRAGEHQAYRWRWESRPGDATGWRALERTAMGASEPWFRQPATNSGPVDIKDAWEPGRFSWGYDLARGWMLTGDSAFAEEFWQSLEQFVEACPPFDGVQWGCGQETAIRATALLWCEGAFVNAPPSTAGRMTMLRTLLSWSGERIADAIGYGLSQRNNHGISEATGLIAIGARLRRSDRRAGEWLERGKEYLDRCVRDQFEPDGWYIQHSFNYLRVALDQLVMAERTLRHTGDRLSDDCNARIRAAIALLAEVTDPVTGEPPLHGANDGAWVLPLSTAAYRDMRPSLTAAAATFDVALRADLTPDQETLSWLRSAPPARAPAPPVPRIATGESGWVHAVTEGACVFARAGAYRSRPGHIDPLHIDVWIGGRAVVRDAGTYRYAASAPWRNGLAAEEVHNTLTLAEHPLTRRGPRFLWLSWPRARVVDWVIRDDGTILFRLLNESWEPAGITHQRSCELSAGAVIVVDRLTVPSGIRVTPRVHWLLDGSADDISVMGSGGAARSEVYGDRSSVRGWISEGYGDKREARSVQLVGEAEGEMFVSVTGFGACRDERQLRARLDAECAVGESRR